MNTGSRLNFKGYLSPGSTAQVECTNDLKRQSVVVLITIIARSNPTAGAFLSFRSLRDGTEHSVRVSDSLSTAFGDISNDFNLGAVTRQERVFEWGCDGVEIRNGLDIACDVEVSFTRKVVDAR